MKQSNIRKALQVVLSVPVWAGLLFVMTGTFSGKGKKPDYGERANVLHKHFSQSVDRVSTKLAKPERRVTVRQLTRSALHVLVSNRDPGTAEQFLRDAFANQVVDAQAESFGWMPGSINSAPGVEDKNRNQVELLPIGPILLGYRERFSPDFLAWFSPHIRASLALTRAQSIKISWTNMYLLQTVNLVLLGQALNDAEAMAQGAGQLEQWIAYTRENGIAEFDSPNYYAADLDALYLGYQFAPAQRERFKAMLDYFWRDIAANYFEGRVLSGAHSRDLDFLHGYGAIDTYAYYEGLREAPSETFSETTRIPLMLENPYHPDAEILALAGQGERLIVQRWGSEPGQDRTNYITPDFAISSVGAGFGPQDKLLSVHLSGDVPNITFMPDTDDSPWGFVLKAAGSGGNRVKPLHLLTNIAAVQERGTILALLTIDRRNAQQVGELGSNILLPAQVDQLLVDGVELQLNQQLQQPLNKEAMLALRKGNAGVVLRLFGVQDCVAGAGRTLLQTDAQGWSSGALRLTHYHGCPEEVTGQTRFVSLGVLMAARQVESAAAFAQWAADVGRQEIRLTEDRTSVTAEIELEGVALSVSGEGRKGGLVSRTVNGAEPRYPALAINGVEIRLP